MARRRSIDKHQPLTISVPGSMMTRLDQELSYKQSRSKWVQDAIKTKLENVNNEDVLYSVGIDTIILHLYSRLPRKDHYRTLRMLYIEGATTEDSQVEGTEAEQ